MSGKVLHDLVTRADKFREQEMKAASRLPETVRHFPSEAGESTRTKREKKHQRRKSSDQLLRLCVRSQARGQALARSVPIRHQRGEEVRKASAPKELRTLGDDASGQV